MTIVGNEPSSSPSLLLLRFALVALTCFLVGILAFAPEAKAQEPNCKGAIVVDAGHGGTDTGAVNGILKESEQNLIVAQQLETSLENDGHQVCMTRTTAQENLSNNDRYTYANTTGAELLVSVHMNASSNPATNYTTTLYGKPRKDRQLADTVLYSGLAPALGIPVRAPYQFASGVLLKSNMPAIIAETVFITNGEEGERLAEGQQILANSTSDDDLQARQYQIAEALKAGIESYLFLSSSQPDSGGGEDDSGGHPKGGPPGKNK